MIMTCNFCGDTFSTVEAFEEHIDSENVVQQEQNLPNIGMQILYPDGKIEFKTIVTNMRILKWLKESSDEFLQRKKSDDKLTEPFLVKDLREIPVSIKDAAGWGSQD